MVQEMQYSSTEITTEVNFADVKLRSKEMEKLRTFSRSLENLNSETLYSKWKRSRGDGSKSVRRPRSISLTTAPKITYANSENKPQSRSPARKNSFHVLQENVFRPRFWTIGASPMEVIKEHNAMHSLDLNNNTKESVAQWEARRRKLGQQFRVTLGLTDRQHHQPPADKNLMERTNGTVGERNPSRGKDDTTRSKTLHTPQRVRRVSEDSRENESSPIVAQFVSEEYKSCQIAKSNVSIVASNPFIELLRVEIPPQSRSTPASPNFLMRKPNDAWDSVENKTNPSGGQNSTVVKDASEIRANKDKLNSSPNTFSLGCAYAVVSQPSPRTKDNRDSVAPAAKMSNGITKEQREELEEEFKKLKKVSLELDKAEIEEQRLNKLNTLPEGISQDGLDSQPFRRFSELNNSFTSRRNSDRPTARALLEIIANSSSKTEKERIQQIEEAFEWIRKELAELRAQDKDIMRTFAKIQAGIRKIKLQRALSSDMDEPYEFDIVDHSIDLSASFSYVPVVKDFNNTFPRRASLI